KKIVSLQLNYVNMELPRSSVKIFTRLKKVSKKGKFRQAPYTPLNVKKVQESSIVSFTHDDGGESKKGVSDELSAVSEEDAPEVSEDVFDVDLSKRKEVEKTLDEERVKL
ncbi:hypothetical protein Tco_0767628, partial [Tanacetum coccineum]